MTLPLVSRGKIIRLSQRLCADYQFHSHRTLLRRSYSAASFQPSTSVFIFSTVHPEPDASAAGVRTSFLIEQLAKSPNVSAVHYVSAKERSKILKREGQENTFHLLVKFGVQFHVVPPNKSDLMQEFLTARTLDTNPMLVIFDRFYAEEMYSFHIHKHSPHAVKVLDMQDMHSLRWARQECVEASKRVGLENLPTTVQAGTQDPRLLRELASIHRMDLTFVCSPFEMGLLRDTYQIPGEKLCLAPLFGYQDKGIAPQSFSERSDFVFVGGFRHDPNIDALFQLRRLWPRIRQGLDDNKASLHIYGAFGSHHKPQECHDPAAGMLVHGYECSLDKILSTKRVLLAPLRFGAGIKGKIVDAWKYGLPVVTTPIGSEGMESKSGRCWPGRVVQSDDQFVRAAIDLYQNVQEWEEATSIIPEHLQGLCGPSSWDTVGSALCRSMEEAEERREKDFVQSVLWHESLRSTEYFSRFIESKNRDRET